jgi:hypothetical protein
VRLRTAAFPSALMAAMFVLAPTVSVTDAFVATAMPVAGAATTVLSPRSTKAALGPRLVTTRSVPPPPGTAVLFDAEPAEKIEEAVGAKPDKGIVCFLSPRLSQRYIMMDANSIPERTPRTNHAAQLMKSLLPSLTPRSPQ